MTAPSNDDQRRVAITGIGLITPFGVGRETSWRNLLAGESAVRETEIGIGAPAPSEVFTQSETGEPVIDLALLAAREAVEDAGLDLTGLPPHRTGCVLGTSKPDLRSFARQSRTDCQSVRETAVDANLDGLTIRPTEFWPNAPALTVARAFHINGPALCPVAACATGLVSLQRGVDLIRDGHCDIVLAGSSDASFVPIIQASFKRLGVLAKTGNDPSSACRPFDTKRNGFVIGEGAAVLVLERLSEARARNANIYAEWLAGGTAADATNLTALDETGEALSRLITDVLRRADVSPGEIDYINLHGTATQQNDRYETRAVKRALGRAVACSSLKGAIGHLLGAAGSIETAVTLLAMRDGHIPPTVNLNTPDPECDLDYTPLQSREKEVRTALKLSLGFGGHLAAAVLRCESPPH